jgi:sigma-B regulation protein RsbU (phosphoserine phosphatase)
MSVALENARLWEQESLYRKSLEREFEIGRSIQQGFLPEAIPQPLGWQILASLKSAREVAGDFYDVFELSEDRVGLVIGDVCDKGLGAALFMTLFRSLLRAASNLDFYLRDGLDADGSSAARLRNAVRLTNNYIAETHGETGMFATIFFGILDLRTSRLSYINCGHLPPFIVDRVGIKASLRPTGPIAGAMPDAEHRVVEVALAPGDLFFAYTDGVTEAENAAGEVLGIEEVVPLLVEPQPLPALLSRVLARVEAHAEGVPQFDDITMLALRRA